MAICMMIRSFGSGGGGSTARSSVCTAHTPHRHIASVSTDSGVQLSPQEMELVLLCGCSLLARGSARSGASGRGSFCHCSVLSHVTTHCPTQSRLIVGRSIFKDPKEVGGQNFKRTLACLSPTVSLTRQLSCQFSCAPAHLARSALIRTTLTVHCHSCRPPRPDACAPDRAASVHANSWRCGDGSSGGGAEYG